MNMEKLNDLVLEEAAGGVEAGSLVKIHLYINWTGEAARNIGQVPSLYVTINDSEGQAGATLSPANNWSTNFFVKRGDSFVCNMDCRQYPCIHHAESTWDPSTNQFVYTLS